MSIQDAARDPRTRETQRRVRIEAVVQEWMGKMSLEGIHSGTILDEEALQTIAAHLRAMISRHYDPAQL